MERWLLHSQALFLVGFWTGDKGIRCDGGRRVIKG